MRRQDDPEVVREEYASETGLLTRSSIYADAEGVDPNDVLMDLVAEEEPKYVLEIGCGPGVLAQRLRSERDVHVCALDISPRMVELARTRGVDARVGDVQDLPFENERFDCLIAAWMLYHVPDIDRGLREIARVLVPGGRLLAVTNSRRHLAELWSLVGQDRYEFPFNAENGKSILERHFSTVARTDFEGSVTFPDQAAASRYVAASIRGANLADRVPVLTAPLRATSRNAILVATKR